MNGRPLLDPHDFEDMLIDGAWDEAVQYVADTAASEGYAWNGAIPMIDPLAQPPFDKFYALCDVEPRFKASWDRKRKDLVDASPSAYDQSLANFAARAGWADDEIVALLVAKRRRWGEKLKRHPGYYRLTIGKARRAHEEAERKREETERAREEEQARLRLLEALPDGLVAQPPSPSEQLAAVSDLLNVRITRFVQFQANPAQYRLETEAGAVTLGDASAFLSLARFRAAVFSATRRVIPRFKDKDWDRIAQALGDSLVIESIGPEATEEGIARAWVAAYVSKHPPINDSGESADGQGAGDAFVGNRSFWKDGRLHIWSERLQAFLATSHFDRVKAVEMGAALRIFGAEPVQMNAYVGDGDARKRINRSAWRLPEAWQAAGDEGEE